MSSKPRDAGAGPLFAWQEPRSPATVAPFPSAARLGFIRRNAAQAARYRRPGAAAAYIAGQVDATRLRLLKSQVDPAVAESDARALERALWAEVHRLAAASRKGGVA